MYIIRRRKELHNIHNTLILHLCISNLIICTCATSFTIVCLVFHLQGKYETVLCYLRHISIFVGLAANFLILTALRIEKYDAIITPFSRILILSTVKRIICFIWVITLTSTICVLLEYWMNGEKKCFNKTSNSETYFYYGLTISVCWVMFFTSLYCYSRIILELRRHDKEIASYTVHRGRLESRPIKMVAILICDCFLCFMGTNRSTTCFQIKVERQ